MLNCIEINIESLPKLRIDFIPKEKTKYDKTAGWIATDCIRLARVMPWVFKDVENLLEHKFQGNENMKDCNSKIFKNYLTIHHMSVPETLKGKLAAVFTHRELVKEWSHGLKHVKVRPHVYSGCKLAAQVMTSDHTNVKNSKIHTKYLS